jgi:ELWxxDGT repeat protein
MKKNLLSLFSAFALLNSGNLAAQMPTVISNTPFITSPINNYSYEKTPAMGNNRFFINGPDVWKTDGTPAGTQIVKSFTITNSNAGVNGIETINNSVYFFDNTSNSNYCNLYKSDGTTAGTTILRTFTVTTGASRGFKLTQINGIAYFILEQGAQNLWKTDGTAAGSVLVKSSLGITSPFLNANGTTVFFAYNAAATRLALWKTDGTGGGTVIVKDSICQPSAGEITQNFTNVNSTIYFTIANKGELWKTDGTAAGTKLVMTGMTYAQSLTNLNGVLYFSNVTSFFSGQEVWTSDGTSAGTIATVNPRVYTGPFAFNNNLYISKSNAGSASDYELYKSNGTQAGTTLLKDIYSGAASSLPQYFFPVNNTLCFTATDANKMQIWKTDGTTNGTSMAYALADTLSSFNGGTTFNTVNGYLLFNHNNKAYSLFVDASTAGIKVNADGEDKLVYPNPASNSVYMNVTESGNAIVYINDLQGRDVLTESLQIYPGTPCKLDVSSLSEGIYILHLKTNSRVRTQKLIIQK